MRHPLVFPSRETKSLEVVTSSLFLVLQGARPLLDPLGHSVGHRSLG